MIKYGTWWHIITSGITTQFYYTEQNFYRGSTELKALSTKLLNLFYSLSNSNPKCHRFDLLENVFTKKYISRKSIILMPISSIHFCFNSYQGILLSPHHIMFKNAKFFTFDLLISLPIINILQTIIYRIKDAYRKIRYVTFKNLT